MSYRCTIYYNPKPTAQSIVAAVDVPDDCHHLSVVQDMIGGEVGSILRYQRVDEQLAIAARSQPCVVRRDVRMWVNTTGNAALKICV